MCKNILFIILLLFYFCCKKGLVDPSSLEEGSIVCTMYDKESGKRQAFHIDLNGNIIRKLTNQNKDVDYVRISPDGKLVAFSLSFNCVGGESNNIGVININGEEERILMSSKGRVVGWSPNSLLILSYGNHFTKVIDINGNNLADFIEGYPQFYGNNNELFIVTPTNFYDTSISGNIFKYELDTGNREFIGYFPPFRTFEYNWKKKFLVFEELTDQIHIYHYNSGEEFIIPYKPYFDIPKWSYNGKYIIFVGFPNNVLSDYIDNSPSILIYNNEGVLKNTLRPGDRIMCADIYMNH